MEDKKVFRRIRFQLYLHYGCNYKCPYCYFLDNRRELVKKDKYYLVDEWIRHWDRIYDKYGSVEIHLTGGEPSTYPNFVELIKELTKKHFLMISTNLSGDFEHFSREIDPEKVKFGIGASFHPSHIDFDSFLKKGLVLKNRGFWVFIVYVAYPPQFKQMAYYKNRFKKEGFNNFVILPFRGSYNGKLYPKDYSIDEMRNMRKLCEEDDNLIENLKYQLSKENESIGCNVENPNGKLCRAGQRFAIIFSDGRVIRCGESSTHIGNLFDESFKLLDLPLPCEQSQCFCEFNWLVEREGEDVEKKEMLNLIKEYPKELEKLPISKIEMIPSNNIIEAKGQNAAPINKINNMHKSLPPSYRVFFNWDIHYKCNYRCSYCFFNGKWEECSKGDAYPGVKKLYNVWERFYEKYGESRIDISGGEPTTYPSFFELIGALSRMHRIRFNTNLSFDVSAFIGDFLPIINERSQYAVEVNSSFHPEEVTHEQFLKKALILKKAGFRILVTYVAYPPHLGGMYDIKKDFESKNITFVIQPFRGTYQDHNYPEGYTAEERKIFEKCSKNNPSGLFEHHLQNVSENKKRFCKMGQLYAKVYPSGNAHRCCAREADKLGNIINDENFSLLENPDYCDLNCPCWKAMIVDKESDWINNWREVN